MLPCVVMVHISQSLTCDAIEEGGRDKTKLCLFLRRTSRLGLTCYWPHWPETQTKKYWSHDGHKNLAYDGANYMRRSFCVTVVSVRCGASDRGTVALLPVAQEYSRTNLRPIATAGTVSIRRRPESD
jgi:hypothetical protein